MMLAICEPLVGQFISTCVKQHPHLVGLKLADSLSGGSTMPMDVLIGSDYYWQLVTGSIFKRASGPIAVHMKLGWVLSGSSHSIVGQCAVNLSITHVLQAEVQPCISDDHLREFREFEYLGIWDEEKILYDDFVRAVKFENGRYEVSLPWRELHDPLLDNHQLSVNTLHGLLHRLKQEPVILKEYDNTI